MKTNEAIIESLRQRRKKLLENIIYPANSSESNFTDDAILPVIKGKAKKLSKEKSGLPDDIWFDEAGKFRWLGDKSPFVKVGSEYRTAIPVTICADPMAMAGDTKALKQLDNDQWQEIYAFISRNYDAIIKHWSGDIGFQAMRRAFLL